MITVLDFLEKSAAAFPDQIICEDAEEALSFYEIFSKANRIGYFFLRDKVAHRYLFVPLSCGSSSYRRIYGQYSRFVDSDDGSGL